jgi:hypothetical protein
MIEQETLFILGAGASNPYQYLTGRQLRTYISKSLPTYLSQIIARDTEFYKKVQTNKKIKNFSETFNKSAIQSIDRWLAMNPRFSEIGKIAIATSILKCEYDSRFWEDVGNPSEDWYTYLYNRMTDGFSSPDNYKKFKDNKVSFITFNYDRSLEHFLYTSLSNSFIQKNVEDLISTSLEQDIIPFPFIHVYGQIDKPTWKWGSVYGEEISWEKIGRLASNIKVIGERTDEQSKINPNLFAKATRIFFLGFGYAPENMEILGLQGLLKGNMQIYGTVYHFTPKEIKQIKDLICYGADISSSAIVLENIDSCSLLKKYL